MKSQKAVSQPEGSRQLERFRELIEVTQSISTLRRGSDLKGILKSTVKAANRVLNADITVIFPYDEENNEFMMDFVVTDGEGLGEYKWQKPRKRGATRKILEREDFFASNISDAPKELKPLLRSGDFEKQFGVVAVAGIPLRLDSEKLGVLYVNYKVEHSFDEYEKDILRVFARTVAIILNNARVYDRENRALQLAEELRFASKQITQASDLHTILIDILDGALNLTRTSEGVIYLLNRVQTEIIDSVERTEGFHPKPRLDNSQGITRTIIDTGDTIKIPDVENDTHINPSIQKKGIRSVIGIPLKDEEAVIGILYLNYFERHNFYEEELGILSRLCEQAVLAIKNINRTRLVQEISQIITGILSAHGDLTTTYESILKNLNKIVPYDGAILHFLEDDRLVSRFVDGFEHPEEVLKFKLEKDKDRIQMYLTRTPIVISDVTIDERWEPVPSIDWVRSWMGVPLIAGGEYIGHFGLYKHEKGFFSSTDKDISLEYAYQAASAIENARFVEQIRYINDIQTLIHSKTFDLDELIHTILDHALKLVDAKIGHILLKEGDSLVISASTNSQDEGIVVDIENSVTGIVAKTKEPVSVSDISKEPYKSRYKTSGIVARSELAVPLIIKGELVGVLNVESTELSAFSESHQDFLVTLANVTATAINLARLSVRELSIIGEVQKMMMGETFQLNEVFETVLNRALEITGAKSGELLLRENDILHDAVAIAANKPVKLSEVSINNSVTGIAVLEKTPVLVNDLSKMGERFNETYKPYKELYKPVLGYEMKSELVVPLLAEDVPLGVINLESEKPFAFTRHHRDLVQTLATESVLAIRAARYIDELFKRRIVQETIAEIQQEILSRAFEREAVLKLILEKGLGLIKANIGQVLLREGERLFVRASTINIDVEQGASVAIDDSVAGFAVRLSKPIRVDDVTTQEPYRDVYKPILGQNMHSELVVPLLIADNVIGVLNIESEQKSAFTQDDELLLEELSRQATLAIRLSGAFADIRALGKVQDDILSKEYSLQEASDLILNYIRQLVSSETGQVLLLDGEKLTITASTNKGDIGTVVDVNDSVSGMAVLENRPVNVSNLKIEEKYSLKYKKFLGTDMLSELVVPLRIGDKIFGVLNAESPREKAFSQHHVDLLTSLAGQAAMAIRTAEQIELQRKVSEQEKLAAVGERSGDIVHRLANPSGAIRQRLELVRQKRAELLASDDYLDRSLGDIDSNAQKIQAMVREMKESTSELLSGYIVQDVILQAKERANIPDIVNITLNLIADLPKVRANQRIIDVLYNLLRNAVEAMPQGGEISVFASLSEGNQFVDVGVQDKGPGIPNELIDEIFKPYFTTKSEEGHGLGLWWSRAYIEKCGGKLMINSKLGEGSTFTVRLPIFK